MANLNNLYVAAGSLVTFGGVDLGHTVDGVEVEWDRKFTDVKTDLYGDTPVDYVLQGQKASVKLKLAEITPGVLAYLMPEADYDVGSSSQHLHFGSKAGFSLRGTALQLVITPQGNNVDGRRTITFFKAVSTEPVTVSYKIDEQSVFEVTFTALIDESRNATDGRLLGRVGPVAIS